MAGCYDIAASIIC